MQKINTVEKIVHVCGRKRFKSGNKEWQIVYPKWCFRSIPGPTRASWLNRMGTIVWVAPAMRDITWHWTFEPISINSNANIEFSSQPKLRMSQFGIQFGIYFACLFFQLSQESNREMTNSNLISVHTYSGYSSFLQYTFCCPCSSSTFSWSSFVCLFATFSPKMPAFCHVAADAMRAEVHWKAALRIVLQFSGCVWCAFI